jgi:hypothetical protein
LFETFLVLRRIQRDIVINVKTSSYELFLSDFNETNFLDIFLKSLTRLVGAEFFRADGRTDRQRDVTQLIVAFRTAANAPAKPKNCPRWCFAQG